MKAALYEEESLIGKWFWKPLVNKACAHGWHIVIKLIQNCCVPLRHLLLALHIEVACSVKAPIDNIIQFKSNLWLIENKHCGGLYIFYVIHASPVQYRKTRYGCAPTCVLASNTCHLFSIAAQSVAVPQFVPSPGFSAASDEAVRERSHPAGADQGARLAGTGWGICCSSFIFNALCWWYTTTHHKWSCLWTGRYMIQNFMFPINTVVLTK